MRVYFLMFLLISSVFAVGENDIDEKLSFEVKTTDSNDKQFKKLKYNKSFSDLLKNKQIIRNQRKNALQTDRELEDLNNTLLAQDPHYKIFKNIDTVYMHIKYPLTLLLPDDVEVLKAKPFPATLKAENWGNLIDLTATGKLTTSTLRVTYMKSGQPGTMSIVVNRYNLEEQADKQTYNIYPIIKYNNFNPLPIKTVLRLFIDNSKDNRNPMDNDEIEIDRVTYRFVEDPFNGYLILDGKKYNLDYNYK